MCFIVDGKALFVLRLSRSTKIFSTAEPFPFAILARLRRAVNERRSVMEYTIYKLTCLITGLGYVGATKNFKRRMSEHHRNNKNNNIAKAIREYGWENFTAEVIEVCDEEVAPERERYWIKAHGTLEPYGYNCTTGGEKGKKHTAESNLRSSFAEIEKTVFPVLQAELNKQLLTRQKFAQKLGFSSNAVSAWMTGKCEPKLFTAIKVKEVLGVDMPLEELFAKSPVQQNE